MSTNYVTKLAIYLASRKAVPDGDIDAIKAAPDNTYGDDDQAMPRGRERIEKESSE